MSRRLNHMDTYTKNEIIGRLWLWSESVSKTKHLLEMAFRANIGKQEEFRLKEHETYNIELTEFASKQPDYKEGIVFPSQRKKFDKLYHRTFPTWLECCAIHDAFVELAIVYFCQILNSGRNSDGQTAQNDDNFRKEHLTNILNKVFPTSAEMDKFDLLKAALVRLRDKVIGHSDGVAYKITHSNPVSILQGPNIGWREIDLEFWHSFLNKMIDVIHNYINILKLQT